jgi:ATP-dependent DNA helicase RecG
MNDNSEMEILKELLSSPVETEWLEFKEAKNGMDFDDLGKYFSAISNEANLKNKKYGWIVLGIEDKYRKIVGTKYRNSIKARESLKHEVAKGTTNNITFLEIYELNMPEGRVLMLKIPPAPRGIPVAWEGHYYGRNGESRVALNIQEIEQIRQQGNNYDWSAKICDDMDFSYLSLEAIERARYNYKEKFPSKAGEVDKWDDITFLNKAKITIEGKLTFAALVLLGKPESTHFLNPAVARITWVLKDSRNMEKDYQHFDPPFLLTVDTIYSKIRNLNYRYMPGQSIFPTELTMYEPFVIREALNNCIAHQDYELKGRIIIVEKEDELIFTNFGSFIPGSVEEVIKQNAPQKFYRNLFLANAMANLNMIDTVGGGIKKMFQIQKDRYFPLPTYELEKPDEVTVRISGKILDDNYTKLLINNTNLELDTVILLDKVQKKIQLNRKQVKFLKSQKLIEGRYPNVYVASEIARITGKKVEYTKNKAFDKIYYQDLITEFLKQHKKASREEIDNLLNNKLPDIKTTNQKKIMINNILNEMSNKKNIIKNTGSRKKSIWILS